MCSVIKLVIKLVFICLNPISHLFSLTHLRHNSLEKKEWLRGLFIKLYKYNNIANGHAFKRKFYFLKNVIRVFQTKHKVGIQSKN